MNEAIQYLRRLVPAATNCIHFEPSNGKDCPQCLLRSAHRALGVLESVPVEALQNAIEMLSEHSAAHKDKREAEYNECDTAPCMWCEKVDAAVPVLLAWLNAYQGKTGETKSGN